MMRRLRRNLLDLMIGSIHKTFTLVDYYADYFEQRMIERKMLDGNKCVVSLLSNDEQPI